MLPRNEIRCLILDVNSTPKKKIYRHTRKIRISTKGSEAAQLFLEATRAWLLDCPCVSAYVGFGVEIICKNQCHIISGKHAQELYVAFYMSPKVSEPLKDLLSALFPEQL